MRIGIVGERLCVRVTGLCVCVRLLRLGIRCPLCRGVCTLPALSSVTSEVLCRPAEPAEK